MRERYLETTVVGREWKTDYKAPIMLTLGKDILLEIGKPQDLDITGDAEEFLIINRSRLAATNAVYGRLTLKDGKSITFGSKEVVIELVGTSERFGTMVRREGDKIIVLDLGWTRTAVAIPARLVG